MCVYTVRWLNSVENGSGGKPAVVPAPWKEFIFFSSFRARSDHPSAAMAPLVESPPSPLLITPDHSKRNSHWLDQSFWFLIGLHPSNFIGKLRRARRSDLIALCLFYRRRLLVRNTFFLIKKKQFQKRIRGWVCFFKFFFRKATSRELGKRPAIAIPREVKRMWVCIHWKISGVCNAVH